VIGPCWRPHALFGFGQWSHHGRGQKFGGLKSEQVKRLKDLETESVRLRRAVSDLTLDKLIGAGACSPFDRVRAWFGLRGNDRDDSHFVGVLR
jgi:hypothetical protein